MCFAGSGDSGVFSQGLNHRAAKQAEFISAVQADLGTAEASSRT